jgi:hypothetical protein
VYDPELKYTQKEVSFSEVTAWSRLAEGKAADGRPLPLR